MSLSAIAGVSGTDAWVAGSATRSSVTRPLLEHWTHGHWAQVLPATSQPAYSAELEQLVAIGRDDIWAVGEKGPGAGGPEYVDYPDTAFAVHWDGHSLRFFNLPAEETSLTVSDIDASAADNVWVSLDAHYGPGSNWGALVRWDGRRWKFVRLTRSVPRAVQTSARCDPDATGEWATEMVATNGPMSTWAEGWYGICAFLLRLKSTGGWTALQPPAREWNRVRDIGVAPDGAIWAATSRGLLRYSRGTWQIERPLSGLLRIDFSSQDGWAITKRSIIHSNE